MRFERTTCMRSARPHTALPLSYSPRVYFFTSDFDFSGCLNHEFNSCNPFPLFIKSMVNVNFHMVTNLDQLVFININDKLSHVHIITSRLG